MSDALTRVLERASTDAACQTSNPPFTSRLTRVLERASTDAAFRAQLASDPERALAGYALTSEEHAALMNGDSPQWNELGVESRLTKDISPPTTDTPWDTPPLVT
jgi:hypothetical protein